MMLAKLEGAWSNLVLWKMLHGRRLEVDNLYSLFHDAMLFPAGSGLVCAAPGDGGDGSDRVRSQVLLWSSGQVSWQHVR